MKLSCLPVSYYPDFRTGLMSITEWADQARRLGLDAIDLSVLMTRHLDQRKLAETALQLKRIGIPVDTIATYTDFTHPNPRIREREFTQFELDVAAALTLGAKNLRITAGQAHPETARNEGVAFVIDYFSRAAEFASRNGIGLLFENHSKPGVWQHYDFAGEPDVYFELVDRLRDVGIALLFDTANACFYGQDPVRMLKRIFSNVRRVHVADIVKANEPQPVLIGTGIVPLAEVFTFLKDNSFSGDLSIEEASFTGFAGIEKAVNTTRNLWSS